MDSGPAIFIISFFLATDQLRYQSFERRFHHGLIFTSCSSSKRMQSEGRSYTWLFEPNLADVSEKWLWVGSGRLDSSQKIVFPLQVGGFSFPLFFWLSDDFLLAFPVGFQTRLVDCIRLFPVFFPFDFLLSRFLFSCDTTRSTERRFTILFTTFTKGRWKLKILLTAASASVVIIIICQANEYFKDGGRTSNTHSLIRGLVLAWSLSLRT